MPDNNNDDESSKRGTLRDPFVQGAAAAGSSRINPHPVHSTQHVQYEWAKSNAECDKVVTDLFKSNQPKF